MTLPYRTQSQHIRLGFGKDNRQNKTKNDEMIHDTEDDSNNILNYP